MVYNTLHDYLTITQCSSTTTSYLKEKNSSLLFHVNEVIFNIILSTLCSTVFVDLLNKYNTMFLLVMYCSLLCMAEEHFCVDHRKCPVSNISDAHMIFIQIDSLCLATKRSTSLFVTVVHSHTKQVLIISYHVYIGK